MERERLYYSSQDRELSLSAAFPALMRKVYIWMTLALSITGITAYGVASSPNLIMAIATNSGLMWGIIIGTFALVMIISSAINRLSLTTRHPTVHALLRAERNDAVVHIPCLHNVVHRASVLHHSRNVCRNGSCGVLHENRPDIVRQTAFHGSNRACHCHNSKHLHEKRNDGTHHQLRGCAYIRRTHGL